MTNSYISTTQAAKILGISRIAVFNQIKSGKIPAQKVGRNYVINRKDIGGIFRTITANDKRKINKAVGKVLKDYSSALKKLGKE
ncbi:MAG: helix-turn-helix domain-containing protein [bacterium]